MNEQATDTANSAPRCLGVTARGERFSSSSPPPSSVAIPRSAATILAQMGLLNGGKGERVGGWVGGVGSHVLVRFVQLVRLVRECTRDLIEENSAKHDVASNEQRKQLCDNSLVTIAQALECRNGGVLTHGACVQLPKQGAHKLHAALLSQEVNDFGHN